MIAPISFLINTLASIVESPKSLHHLNIPISNSELSKDDTNLSIRLYLSTFEHMSQYQGNHKQYQKRPSS